MCLAVPGRVERIFEEDGIRMGKMNFGGVFKNVCLAYLPEIEVGQYAVVHVGFAISRVDEQVAQETLETFAELGLVQDEMPGHCQNDSPIDAIRDPQSPE